MTVISDIYGRYYYLEYFSCWIFYRTLMERYIKALKKKTSTSKQGAKHRFPGWNTQYIIITLIVCWIFNAHKRWCPIFKLQSSLPCLGLFLRYPLSISERRNLVVDCQAVCRQGEGVMVKAITVSMWAIMVRNKLKHWPKTTIRSKEECPMTKLLAPPLFFDWIGTLFATL